MGQRNQNTFYPKPAIKLTKCYSNFPLAFLCKKEKMAIRKLCDLPPCLTVGHQTSLSTPERTLPHTQKERLHRGQEEQRQTGLAGFSTHSIANNNNAEAFIPFIHLNIYILYPLLNLHIIPFEIYILCPFCPSIFQHSCLYFVAPKHKNGQFPLYHWVFILKAPISHKTMIKYICIVFSPIILPFVDWFFHETSKGKEEVFHWPLGWQWPSHIYCSSCEHALHCLEHTSGNCYFPLSSAWGPSLERTSELSCVLLAVPTGSLLVCHVWYCCCFYLYLNTC